MKKLLTGLLGIVMMCPAMAQNYLDKAGLNASSPATVAYAFRKLSTTYSGPAIQVRRSSDNSQQNIGFDANGELDSMALKAFVGASNAFVNVWYDQSGNNRNLVQTNQSRQPTIIVAGKIIRRNGSPTSFYDDSDDGMLYPGASYLTSAPLSVNIVAGSNSNSSLQRRAVQGNNNWLIGPYNNNHSWFAQGWNHEIGTPWSITEVELFTVIEPTCSSNTSWRNGVRQSSGNSKGVPLVINTGVEGAYGERFDGFISEILVFNFDLNSNERQGLEGNQSAYYGIVYTGNNDPVSASICVQPATGGETLCNNAAATTLSVQATGLGFQWYSNAVSSNSGGTAIAGATARSFIPPSSVSGTTYYYVEVAGTGGTMVASIVSGAITVLPDVVISISGLTTGIDSVTLTASGGINYTWSGGTSLNSATNTFTISDEYSVIASNAQGCQKQSNILVSIQRLALSRFGGLSIDSLSHVNDKGVIAGNTKVDQFGRVKRTVSKDGRTALSAGISAFQIKTDYPASVDGTYWIYNASINGGAPFKIYADMTTNGGGWTLILCNKSPNPGWNSSNALLRNELSPNVDGTYSIIGWADYIKKAGTGFQYMIDAQSRGAHGGIWTANAAYSFTSNSNANTNITLNTKFGSWSYADNGIEERMPWYSPGSQGLITTSNNANSEWWGTLIASSGWNPAPWINATMAHPGIIWYWVR